VRRVKAGDLVVMPFAYSDGSCDFCHDGLQTSCVQVPHYQGIPGAVDKTFYDNVTVGGGPAPVRAYIEELLPDILEGRIEPGQVFDRVVDLDQVPDGYRAMDERKSLKVMIAP
jgi:threonine dehydrogenase-like Zn-dependent dehydrogenase